MVLQHRSERWQTASCSATSMEDEDNRRMILTSLSDPLYGSSIVIYCQVWEIAGDKRRSPWQPPGHAFRFNIARVSAFV